jgi:hypothetical protein
MPKQAAEHLQETERRIARQIARITELEAVGHLAEARRAREVLGTITDTRDALRLRLQVVRRVAATEVKWRPLLTAFSRTTAALPFAAFFMC